MASANNILPLTDGMWCYLWKIEGNKTIENASFPGVKMEKAEEKFQTYGIKDTLKLNYTGCIFSDGSNLNQTVDVFKNSGTSNPTNGTTYKITGRQVGGDEDGKFNGIFVDLNTLLKKQ